MDGGRVEGREERSLPLEGGNSPQGRVPACSNKHNVKHTVPSVTLSCSLTHSIVHSSTNSPPRSHSLWLQAQVLWLGGVPLDEAHEHLSGVRLQQAGGQRELDPRRNHGRPPDTSLLKLTEMKQGGNGMR